MEANQENIHDDTEVERVKGLLLMKTIDGLLMLGFVPFKEYAI